MGSIFVEIDLGAVEGAVESVGEETGAVNWRKGAGRLVQVRGAPGALPGEDWSRGIRAWQTIVSI